MTDFDHLPHEEQLKALLELARAATKNYALPDHLAVEMINLSENATYRVEAPNGQRMGPARSPRWLSFSKTAIASELAWLMDLRKHGSSCHTAPREGARRRNHSDGFPPADGDHAMWSCPIGKRDRSRASAKTCQSPLRCLARSRPACICMRGNGNVRHGFSATPGILKRALATRSPIGDAGATAWVIDAAKAKLFGRTVDLIGKRLKAYGQDNERFGLIHCDLRLANLLIDEGQVKVIDFDDCGFGWYMYDAATPVSFYEHEPQVPELIESWKTGYRRVIELPKADEAEIPTFVMLRRLLLVAWIGSHSETDLGKVHGPSLYGGNRWELC